MFPKKYNKFVFDLKQSFEFFLDKVMKNNIFAIIAFDKKNF